MLSDSDWIELRPKRAAITAALKKAGIPFNGWANDRPNFEAGFEPDWKNIERLIREAKDVPVPEMQGEKRRKENEVKRQEVDHGKVKSASRVQSRSGKNR